MNFTQPPYKNMRKRCNSSLSKTDIKILSTPTIETAIFQIIGAPKRWPITESEIRRYLTPKFSYAILYRVYADRIVIAAIMSCRRDPNYWKDRLEP